MPSPPFPREAELEKRLQFPIQDKADGIFNETLLIDEDESDCAFLPGLPHFLLPYQEPQTIIHQLSSELLTPDLDRIAPYFWLISTLSSSHITSLHAQALKGRHITITENPELHCTWISDRVFIKPIPPCILSWAFWQSYILPINASQPSAGVEEQEQQRRQIARAALGLLRTYSYLIRHPSDFRLANQHHLLPERISYNQCCRFFGYMRSITDTEVGARYSCGELRLGRLNFWSKIFLGRFTFQKVAMHYAYGTYFERFYGPLLFTFACFTVILSAMQVALTVETTSPQRDGWRIFGEVCRWFGVGSIVITLGISMVLLLIFGFLAARESVFVVKTLKKKQREQRR